jgi:hypothetical protein
MTLEQAKMVADALAKRFTAYVEPDEVAPGRFSFRVFSKHYDDIPGLQRQEQAWEVVDRILSRDESEDVVLVILYGPEDVATELVEMMP